MSTIELDFLKSQVQETLSRKLSPASLQESLRTSAHSLLQEATSSLEAHFSTLQGNIDTARAQLHRGSAAVQALRELQQREMESVGQMKKLTEQRETPLEEIEQKTTECAQKLAEIEVVALKRKVLASGFFYDPDNARVTVQLENRKLYNVKCNFALVMNSLEQCLWPELNVVLTGSEKKQVEVQLLQALTAGTYMLQIFDQKEALSNRVFFTVV